MRIPDLLFNEAELRLDEDALAEVLGFAFATGKAPKLLEDCLLKEHEDNDSGFHADSFSQDLYLQELVADCFPLDGFGKRKALSTEFFYRQLCNPPTDPKIIRFRQDILAELVAEPESLDELRNLYAALRRLVWAFDTSGRGVHLDLTEFRMTIVNAILEVVHLMRDSFAGSQSGLSRIHEAGKDVVAGAGYQELAALVNYEGELSNVDVRIRVNAIGKMCGFHILDIRENETNPFYSNPWQRMWEKAKLFMRGYRFNDVDLVGELVSQVFGRMQHEIIHFVQLLGQVEFYLMALGFRTKLNEQGLATCLPQFSQDLPPQMLLLVNPLLLHQGVQPAPCNLRPPRKDTITLVTGPNSGGKTRLLQAIGIAQLMGQSGMFVAAESARLRVVSGMFASLLELETLDAPEGRLGQELIRIHRAFSQCPFGAMLLVDELCSGTNPSEGSEIMSLVLEMLSRLQPQAYITTHFLDYVRSLEAHPPVPLAFIQVELSDAETPTYDFVRGVATSSLARRIAERLGVSRSELEGLVQNKARQARRGKSDLRVIA